MSDYLSDEKLKELGVQAKKEWGNTDVYMEYEAKASSRDPETEKRIMEGLVDIFRKFGTIKDKEASCAEAQEQVETLKKYISDNFYGCNNTMLSMLGKMYVRDERFKNEIDSVGGEGTAVFVSEAIEHFTKG